MLTSIATLSYSIATAAFLALCLALLTLWRARPHASSLAVACFLSALWACSSAIEAWDGPPYSGWIDFFECCRNAAWSAFLLNLLGYFRQRSDSRPAKLLVLFSTLYFVYLAAVVARELSWTVHELIGFMPLTMGRMTFAVLGMLLIEHLYRNKQPQDRWAIKFVCLGIGGLFVYDFYLYSDAALFRTMNADIWAARGLVDALCVPLIALSVRRSSAWAAEISVSRRVLFHSAALFGSAIYLLLMGFAGYFLRFFGGRWGSVMQVAFLFGAAVLLLGILFSGSFRAWLRVFISKHFYSYNYDYREEWLRFTRTLSGDGPALGERSIHAIATLVESPGGVLWIRRDSGRFEPAAHLNVGAPIDTLEATDAFVHFLETKQWVVDLQEYEQTPELYDHVALPGWIAAFPRGWLVVPLILQNQLLGFILLVQPRSAVTLDWEVIDLLKIAGSQAASYLAQQEAAAALMLARQFESFNRMSTFIVHDLKNLVSQLSLLTANAEKHKDNPEFQADMVETVTLSVQKMKLMLQKLSRTDNAERNVAIALDKLITQAVALKAAFDPKPSVEIEERGLAVLADAERLERVVGHIIQNAIEATPREGQVKVRLTRAGAQAVIEVTDTGTGMSEEFIRERLFKPFESTKSAGMGIGAFESREYIQELGGTLEVASREGQGTTFRIVLRLHQPNKDQPLSRMAAQEAK
ncbi:PEP-CTERM system histidine kinase PrsK [Massilia arenosa]|uniref:histidine kinase n=1 Tax=Zemynaea arenosa TaxID=2561931 RepID=A0A4Y9SG17_9BURK|nr:XrtA/PEP-CTERM system histidine kinase PrsK [Massilia arenosa]TFW22767.1 PEP-CTERM system histidine kinase PrsK [Massilia arenosa]